MSKFIFLYEINDGEKMYFYTNGDMNVIYDAKTFVAVPISHKNISIDVEEVAKSTVKIIISNQTPYIQKLLENYDTFITNIKIMRYYPYQKKLDIEFVGSLSRIEISDTDTTCTVGNVLYETQRQGLRQVYQRLCPYALYGCQCCVDKEKFSHTFMANSFKIVNQYTVHCTVPLPEHILGGIMLLSNNAYYFIKDVNYDEQNIVVSRPIYSRFFTGIVMLFDGCDRSMTDCNEHFNNSANFGGFVLLPLENPTTKNHT